MHFGKIKNVRTLGFFLLFLVTALNPGHSKDNFDSRVIKVVTQNDPGTAFVIGPAENGRCLLVTAQHVLDENSASEPLIFLLPTGAKFSLLRGSFKSAMPELDFAFTPVSSCKNSIGIPFARGSAITVSTKVDIKGYPVDKESVHSVKVFPFTVTGRVTQYKELGPSAGNKYNGYDLSYDASTQPGYSGGPVLNEDGNELMALHGFTDTVKDIQDVGNREKLRVGGRGISAPLIYRFLKESGYKLPRSDKMSCMVGVC